MQIKTKSPEEQLKKKLKSKLFSMKGAFWEERELNSFQKNQLIKTFNLTNIFANLLTSRGVNVETYKSFLSPKLKDLFPDPSQMDQMDLATKKIVEFISKKKKIGIFGDYDVDGTTSTALIGNYLKDIGAEFEFYIPDRINEGYGPNI